jgi:Fic family protein
MWFASVAIEALRRTIATMEFQMDRTKMLDRLKGQLNDRQEKALLRMFREGPEGFRGGLTAGKYSTITGISWIWLPNARWFVRVNVVTLGVVSVSP